MALPKGPGWEWNPGATFVTAFNNAQENKRANEKMALDQELAAILLPQKRAEAEFNLKKLAYDTERLTLVNKLGIEEIETKRRFLKTNGLGFGGQTSGANSGSNVQQPKADDPLSFKISTTPSSFKIGGGVQPIKTGP
jgi:hypothetical protein